MKNFRFGLPLSAIVLVYFGGAKMLAKEPKLTLEDVIFDSKYVAEFLGEKTLLQFEGDSAPVLEAIKESGFAKKTSFVRLPAQAKQANPIFETPPYLSESSKWLGETNTASFFIFVGADGQVKALYCYNHNEKLFALSVAKAITKWRFKPAMINDTAVPVLYVRTINYAYLYPPGLRNTPRDTDVGHPGSASMPQSAPL